MSRIGKLKKRTITPDPIYQDRVVAHLINRAMRDGKKAVAEKQIYQALELIGQKTKEDPLKVFTQALENIKPNQEVKSRRVGGAAYQVPMSVAENRRESLAIRWLLSFANQRPNSEHHHFYEKLAAEILDAQQNQGGAVKKKTDIHRMAEANKAFAHFRW